MLSKKERRKGIDVELSQSYGVMALAMSMAIILLWQENKMGKGSDQPFWLEWERRDEQEFKAKRKSSSWVSPSRIYCLLREKVSDPYIIFSPRMKLWINGKWNGSRDGESGEHSDLVWLSLLEKRLRKVTETRCGLVTIWMRKTLMQIRLGGPFLFYERKFKINHDLISMWLLLYRKVRPELPVIAIRLNFMWILTSP